jgi:lysozyme
MTILGIDLSHWDGEWNADVAKAAGVRFAYIKATQSTYIVDDTFEKNKARAKAAGIVFGLYHYVSWDNPAADQANFFVTTARGDWGQLPPALDYEERGKVNGVDHVPSDAVGRLWAMTQIVRSVYGKPPVIYTGPDYWKNYGALDSAWSQFPLWDANWEVTKPLIPAPWKSYFMWQKSGKGPGSVYGASSQFVDLNEIPMTEEEWQTFLGVPPAHLSICPTCNQAWPVICPPVVPPSPTYNYIIFGGNPNLHSPNISSPIVKTLMAGTKVFVDDMNSDKNYAHITLPQPGWIWKYLRPL